MRRTRRRFLGLGASALALTLRSRRGMARGQVSVVSSFSILSDLVRAVGGDQVGVVDLVPIGANPHHFEPKASELRLIREARMFVINGLGFEGWAGRVGRAAGFQGIAVLASKGVDGIRAPVPASAPAPAHNHAHAHGGVDPHCWHDVANAKIYVANIRDGLIAADPPAASLYQERAAAYLARLDALDTALKARLAPIPLARRRVVTTHDSFAYYARAYQLDFLSPLAFSGHGEPSAKEFAALIGRIKRERIRALFTERGLPSRMMEQLSRETDARIAGALYADTLSPPDGPAPTYLAMMRYNTELIAGALA